MIYLDNSATTRPFDEVIEAMAACMREEYFNPSSLYAPAMKAGGLMTAARGEAKEKLFRMGCGALIAAGADKARTRAILEPLRGGNV